MGLLDFGAQVVLTAKVDVAQARAALKNLSAEERKAAEAAIKHTEASNKAIEAKAKRLQFAAQAVGGLTAAYAVGKAGIEAYAKTSTSAAAEAKKLGDAGTKAFDSLMSSIGKAVVGLEPLITGVSKLVQKLSDVGVAGPAAIGALALAVTGNPVIAGIIGGTAWAASGEYGVSTLRNASGDYDFRLGARRIEANEQRKRDLAATSGRYNIGDAGGDLNKAAGFLGDLFVEGLRRVGVDKWSPFQSRAPGAYNRGAHLRSMLGSRSFEYDFESTGSATVGSAAGRAPEALDLQGYANAAQTNRWRAELDYYNQRKADSESALAKTFGPLSEFNAYTTAFETLSGAVGSAMSAWIDGSMSAGKAFKAFVAESVKGLAVQMTIEALKHGAYAVGSLIPGTPFFNPAAAAGYAKTAALFAAGAVAAGAAAKGLHSGGTAPSTGGGYSASAPSLGGTPGGSAGTNVTIVYGDSFARDNPHERQLEAQRLVRLGLDVSKQAVRAH